jgi:hypothetical protein
MDTIEKILVEIRDQLKSSVEVEGLYNDLNIDDINRVSTSFNGVSLHSFKNKNISVYLDWDYSWTIKSLFNKQSRYECVLSYYNNASHMGKDTFISYDYPVFYEILDLTEELMRIRKINNVKFIVNGVEQ